MNEKIIGIYNANGGFIGEVNYFIGKVINNCHCSLCEITNGKFSSKKEWLDLSADFPIKIETIHINEMDEKLSEFVGEDFPCVVYKDSDGSFFKLLDDEELLKCNKSPKEFFSILRDKLDKVKSQ